VDRLTNIIYLNSNDVAWRAALAAVDEAASPGERIYSEQCSSCHGADREGSPPEYPTLVGVGSRLSTAEFIRVVHNGKGRMPGFPHIRRAELNALTGWLMNSSSDRSEVTSSSSRNRNRFRFTGYRKWLDDDGYPAVAPPWGTLNAIDLDTGEYVWRIPFGEYPELAAQGMFTGSENYGGPVVTAGGVLIIGATIYDRKLRAFDAGNGTLLWQHVLPYSGTATPITYRVGGKQFVVIAASGSRDPKGPQGSAYVAFALP
jgi:quinoprotein glucose dehydrogenase